MPFYLSLGCRRSICASSLWRVVVCVDRERESARIGRSGLDITLRWCGDVGFCGAGQSNQPSCSARYHSSRRRRRPLAKDTALASVYANAARRITQSTHTITNRVSKNASSSVVLSGRGPMDTRL